MRRTRSLTLTVIALATTLATVTACAGGEEEAGTGPAGTTDTGTAEEPAGDVVLTTGESELGEIVVDGDGMTVYYFSTDEPGSGKSTCTGECLATWPPVHAGSEDPQVEGVDAEVGTITGTDGELQVTLDGRPVYLYAGDSAPGDVTGQGLNDVWWVVAPDGSEITELPGSGSDTDSGY